MKGKKIINLIIILFGLTSCNNVSNDKDSLKENIDTTLVDYSDRGEYALEIKINGVNERIEIFDTNNVLKRVQLYTRNILDSMMRFYNDGNVNSINTFWSDNGNIVDNTWIYFTSTGDTLNERSYFFLIDSAKSYYNLNEYATIFLRVNRPKYGDSLFVSECFKISKGEEKNVKVLRDEIGTVSNSMFINIPTSKIGVNRLEFTISDCLVESDSSLYCRPIKGVFEYEVRFKK